jgi:hypothetical protein
MNTVSSLTFPVLAFTPNGVMPYSCYENLLRVMKHEYEKNWYKDLEIIDSRGACVIVRSARIVKEPMLARLFGRMVEVEIEESETLANYDVDAVRSRVIEYLSIYPEMHQAAGYYDELVRSVNQASTPAAIVQLFLQPSRRN